VPAGVDLGVVRSPGGAGHRQRRDDLAPTAHEQLGAGADQPVDAEQEAPREALAQPLREAQGGQRMLGLGPDLACEHDLVRVAGPDVRRRAGHRVAPVVRVVDRHGAHLAGAGRQGDRWCDGLVTDHRLPGGAVVVDAHLVAGDHQLPVRIGPERSGPDGDRVAAERCEGGGDAVGSDATELAAARHAKPVLDEGPT